MSGVGVVAKAEDSIQQMRKGRNIESLYQLGGDVVSNFYFRRFLHHRDTSVLFDTCR
jgi:hypothetical protein